MSGKYLPNPRLEKDSIGTIERFIEGENYLANSNQDVVAFGEFGLVRNLPVQTIKIYPIQFDGGSNTIKFLKKL